MLESLSAEIDSDLRNTGLDIQNLSERPDLTAKEKSDLKGLIAKWKQYESSAHDTLDIGSTDAPMATMMLGEADDKFAAMAADIKGMTNTVAGTTDQISKELYTDAARKKIILAIGAIIGLLLSIVATILVSQIDRYADKVRHKCDAAIVIGRYRSGGRLSRPSRRDWADGGSHQRVSKKCH